jgi:hypothetical protein
MVAVKLFSFSQFNYYFAKGWSIGSFNYIQILSIHQSKIIPPSLENVILLITMLYMFI